MIEEYKTIKKLGRGAFGTVYLVQDEEGNQFAIKQLDKRRIAREPYLEEYLKGEIDIMKELNSPYIIKLYKTDENEKYIYILCQYCNGGDLEKDQAKQPNKTYTLEDALLILSEVLRGLELIHSSGYLHRDIKSQNILVTNQNNQKKYKIADFGLSKKGQGSTVLGTGHFMSPEIYLEEGYSFEVDMWAFGIMLYFMLNKQYPFKQNPHDYDLKRKYHNLVDQAKNFSYRNFIENKSKLKLVENCNEQTEDLFAKIFEVDPIKRISFADIRKHPLFIKYFPQEIRQESKIMYKSKFTGKLHPDQRKKQIKSSQLQEVAEQEDGEEDTILLRSTIRPKNKEFPNEKQMLHRKNDQIQFLNDNYNEFKNSKGILKLIQSTPLCYNLIKYYIILKRNFLAELKTGSFIKKFENYNMKGFANTKEFPQFVAEVQHQLDIAENQFELLHEQCAECLDDIEKINNKFGQNFNGQIKEKQFDDPFKSCYRKSTLYVFQKLKKILKQKKSGNRVNYFLVMSVISHVFNHIFVKKDKMKDIFHEFLEAHQQTVDTIDYEKLREWMTTSTPSQLNNLAKLIIQQYFT